MVDWSVRMDVCCGVCVEASSTMRASFPVDTSLVAVLSKGLDVVYDAVGVLSGDESVDMIA